MPTVDQARAVARSQLGYREAPTNRTKFGQAYGCDGVAWCQIFCWWVLREAGGANLLPKSAFTPYVFDWFKARSAAGNAPRPGALVFFNWRDGSRKWPLPQHVGLVESVNPNGSLITIEGNTQSGTVGNQSDGGGVYRRARAATPHIVGYGYPAYTPGGDWFDMATKEELAQVINAAIDQRLGRVIWETTGSLPNRRGPDGSEIPGGGVDSVFGYAMNADGFGYRIEQMLKQVADRIGAGSDGPLAITEADRAALARDVAAELATRLAQ